MTAKRKGQQDDRGDTELLAKHELSRQGVAPLPSIANVLLSEARAYIRQVMMTNRYTLAARNLDEMDDEDVLRLYRQIRELEAKKQQQEP